MRLNNKQLLSAVGEILKILSDLNQRVTKLENLANPPKQEDIQPGVIPPVEGG